MTPTEQVEAISGDTEVVEGTNSEPQAGPEDEIPEAMTVTDGLFKGVEVKETPPEGFMEVYIIGMQYTDYFTDGTNTYEFAGDPEIHAHIVEKDAPIPTHEGLTWVKSHGRYLYDTASGELEEGQYAIQRSGTIVAKYPPFISSTSTQSVAAPSAPVSSGTTEPSPGRRVHAHEILWARPSYRNRREQLLHPGGFNEVLVEPQGRQIERIGHTRRHVPDLVFGLQFADGTRHSFMVEIDRGTMPVSRSDFLQTSFERKMRAYLTAHAGKQHEREFGWKTFRVLTVTTDHHRTQSMMEALRKLHVPNSIGAPLFFFTTRDELRAADPLTHEWRDGNGRTVRLI